MTTKTNNYQVWVGCLAAYNSGVLHGAWIDLTQDLDSVHEEIKKILKDSPAEGAEEWEIFDYDFDAPRMMSLEELHECVNYMIDTNSEDYFLDLLDYFDYDEAKQWCDNFQGYFEDLEDYARDWCDQTGAFDDFKSFLVDYIDFERMGEDWERNGDIHTVDLGYKKLAVFQRP